MIIRISGLNSVVSQSQVRTFSGARSAGVVVPCVVMFVVLEGLENKLTASAADRNTAPAVMVTLDLLTVYGLFQGLNSATNLVGFSYSTLCGQDIGDLFLKIDCQFPIGVHRICVE